MATLPFALVGTLTALACISFVLADLVYRVNGGLTTAPMSRWKIDEDGSFAEITGYIAFLVAAIVLIYEGLKRPRATVLIAWAAVLTLIALDDMLQLHETWGGAAGHMLGIGVVFGLGPQEWGELLFWVVAGALSLVALIVSYLRSGRDARRASWYLVSVIAVLAVTAVGIDMIAVIAKPADKGFFGYAMAMSEAGGELLAAGLFLAIALGLLRQRRLSQRAAV